MSRFIEALQTTARRFPCIDPRADATMLGAARATGRRDRRPLPYFITKYAPVSGVASLLDYEVTLRVEAKGGKVRTVQRSWSPLPASARAAKRSRTRRA